MKKNIKNPPLSPISVPPEGLWSNLAFLPIEAVGTTWSTLRSDNICSKASDLRDMPIRVVLHEGCYEVIDGFKRLNRWMQSGFKQVPALIEQCADGLSPKRLLLESNSPKRTLCAMDEARVVNSLVEVDGLTVRAVANLLGRRKEWVIGRRSLMRLSLQSQKLLTSGRINLMVARLLTAIQAKDQDTILAAVEKHGLKMPEAQLLIQTWRSASDEEKPGLLADPLFKREQSASPGHSARLKSLEVKLTEIRNALNEFRDLVIPSDLADVEQRRLQAICASIQNQINEMAEGLEVKESVTTQTAMPADPEKVLKAITSADSLQSACGSELEHLVNDSGFASELMSALQRHNAACGSLECSG